MKLRSADEVMGHLIGAGLTRESASAFSEGAGLRGANADRFVLQNRVKLGDIDAYQQKALFQVAYAEKEEYARGLYARANRGNQDAVAWDDLNPKVRDVAVDFAYQGTNHAQFREIARNDPTSLIKYIQSDSDLMRYESGRRRLRYLSGGN